MNITLSDKLYKTRLDEMQMGIFVHFLKTCTSSVKVKNAFMYWTGVHWQIMKRDSPKSQYYFVATYEDTKEGLDAALIRLKEEG
jgi:hypothetical protein